MILYHGTNQDFSEIDLRKSKPNKDFGQGFYLSREYAQAMDMAKTKVEQMETGVATVQTYEAEPLPDSWHPDAGKSSPYLPYGCRPKCA